MSGNRARLFAEVVSLDAWHQPFVVARNRSQVHVEITFKEGRLGGDDADFPLTFTVKLKGSTLTVKLEPPLEVDRKSVARNIPETQVQQSRIRAIRDSASASLKAGARLGPGIFSGGLQGDISAARNVSRDEEMRVVQTVPPILSIAEPHGPNEYRWTLEPSYLESLLGQPWDPSTQPRLSAKYDVLKIGSIDPVISVYLSCAEEDLDICDIVPKDLSLAARVDQLLYGDPRLAAAKQHIRKVLQKADLEPGRMDNRFASLALASVISATEND